MVKANPRVLSAVLLLVVVLSLPFYSYEWTLFMHIVGTVLFLGNMVVSAAWMSLARQSRDPRTLRFTAAGVAAADAYFTLPGALLLSLNGTVLSVSWFDAGQAGWLYVSIALFVSMVVVWVMKLVPCQRRMVRLGVSQSRSEENLPQEFHARLKNWYRWGGIVTLICVFVLGLMVLKPNLW